MSGPEKFFRTVLVIEVLTAHEAFNGGFDDLAEQTMRGDASGMQLTRVVEQCSAAEIIKLLDAQGSDPAFLLGEEDAPGETAAARLAAVRTTLAPILARTPEPKRRSNDDKREAVTAVRLLDVIESDARGQGEVDIARQAAALREDVMTGVWGFTMLTPLDTIDYCSTCAQATGDVATVTQYADEICLCCGREWGDDESGACTGKHVNGDIWWQLLDADQGNTTVDPG